MARVGDAGEKKSSSPDNADRNGTAGIASGPEESALLPVCYPNLENGL
jgi:hypothetical protein